MKVLVVDDDLAMRRFVGRALRDAFRADVAEADDGVTALEYLLTNSADIVLLDLQMPVIGGLETLETIRRSSQHADVPVILMTGRLDEAGLRRAQRLGIAQIVAKPFSTETLIDRITRVIGDAQTPVNDEHHLLDLAERDLALVVDSSPEFRALLRQELGRVCIVEEAANEFAALSRCLSAQVGLLVVGTTSELSSVETFGRKMRGLRKLHDLRLVAAVAEPDPKLSGLYDAVIVRSFVPESVRSSLAQVFAPHTLGRLLFHHSSPTLQRFGDLMRDALSTVVGQPVTTHEEPPAMRAESRRVVASVEIQGPRTGWDLRLVCAMSTALEAATQLLGKNVDELAEGDAPMAIGRLLETVARELRQLVGAEGLETRVMNARVSADAAVVERVQDPVASLWHQWFTTRDHEVATLSIMHLGAHLSVT